LRAFFKFVFFASLSLATTFAHAADKSAELRDRLRAASELSAIDSPTLRPWHWKLDVSLSDTDGAKQSAGNLEMWFSGSNMLMGYSLGSERMSVLRVGDKLYRTPGEVKQLPMAAFLQLQLMHPIPDQVFASRATEAMTKEKNGAIELDSITASLVKSTNEDGIVSADAALAFLLESSTARLVMTYEPGGFRIIRQSLGAFQAHEVPTDLALYLGNVQIAGAKTVQLDVLSPDETLFQVTPEMIPLDEPIEVAPDDISRMALSRSPPDYPIEAKKRHAAGKLVFDAVIGRDGHVQSLQPAGTGDPALWHEANTVIRTWIYRPFAVNGIPVGVKTKIIMNFTSN
jgi:hypothetical protein